MPPSTPLPDKSTATFGTRARAASECCQSPPPPMCAKMKRTSGWRAASAHSSTASDAMELCALAARHPDRSEEHTSELQSRLHLVCRLLLEKKKKKLTTHNRISRRTLS